MSEFLSMASDQSTPPSPVASPSLYAAFNSTPAIFITVLTRPNNPPFAQCSQHHSAAADEPSTNLHARHLTLTEPCAWSGAQDCGTVA